VKPFRRYAACLLLAACVAAALFARRFVYLAWYPVLMSAATALGFGLSLFRAKTLCEELAEKIPPRILPPGAAAYCRACTWFWTVWLATNGLVALATVYAPGPRWHFARAGLDVPVAWVVWNCCLSYCATALFCGIEWCLRRRRFAAVFHTSGSTARPKTIVKTFATLARETAWHRRALAPVLAARPLFLATIEPDHMYGKLWRVLLPQASGCPVDPEVVRTPETLLAKMRGAERVVLVTTPSFLAHFAAYADQYDVPRVCTEIVTSGALLTAEVSAAAKRIFGVAPREIFGSTETGGVAWRRQDEPCADGFDWHVLDPVRVACDAEGRLVVRSPFSFRRTFAMGDAVDLAPDGRRFKLLGRRDRLVKIAEQRVSLPEMEAKMTALPEVAEAALAALDGPNGAYLGAVVRLAPETDVTPGKRALARSLRRALQPVFPPGAAPRRYRFVHALPRNAQGKVRAAEVRRLLLSSYVEPFVSHVTRTETTWSADFVFDADAPYFQGHFPDFPILPGVVQLATAHLFAERFAGRAGALRQARKLKFSQVVRPGETIRFTLERKGESDFAFVYEKGGRPCSSGVLCF